MPLAKKIRCRDLGYAVVAATVALPFVFYAVRSLQVNIYVDVEELSAVVDAMIASVFAWFVFIALWLALRWLYVTYSLKAERSNSADPYDER